MARESAKSGWSTRFEDDPELRDRVLGAAYLPHVRYLRSAELTVGPEPESVLTGRGDYAIPTSCYMHASDHFTAVEFVLCCNQLMKYTCALAVRQRLIDSLSAWDLATYEARREQLYIVDFHSRFRRPIDPRAFRGEITIQRVVARGGLSGPLILIDFACRFWDETGGASFGEIKVAAPQPAMDQAS